MPLVTLSDLSIRFRGPLLLDSVSCQLERGQRIGLLGRNGAGKTTLLRILSGDVEPDSGEVKLEANTQVALLPQDVPSQIAGTIREVVASGWTAACGTGNRAEVPPWEQERAVEEILSRMELDGEARFERLSSGMKRRALLAQALVTSPDLLLLDEPTNHLDLEAILWLEEFLGRWRGTLMFITHDRQFLRKLADRILEIDRGRLFDWSCDYETFLQRKEAALQAEEQQQALFDKRLAEEEAWIRQGIKARRTRNEGRVKALKRMREQRLQRRSESGSVKLLIQSAARSGNLVAAVEKITFAYPDREIVRDFSTTIMRGDKVGVIGPNGAGKTTLLRLLLGKLTPQSGEVRLGTNLQLAYFDQLREQLDEGQTVQENVGEGSDTVAIGGKAKHVLGYLQDFLFSPERARTPVRFLSGGERNRVLLAKLFCKPANVIVLDEPTNDLDAETLELLEERLVQYDGTLLVVSHDREFLNNVVTSTIVFEEGGVREYDGGYDDWVRQRARPGSTKPKAQAQTQLTAQSDSGGKRQPPREDKPASAKRLSFKEQRELEGLPERIEALESEVAQLHQQLALPEFYQQPGEQIAAENARLETLQQELADAYQRWEELEQRGG